MAEFRTKNYLDIEIAALKAAVTLMTVSDVLKIHYVAVRGRDNEQGSVQRVLSPVRLDSIEKYVLNGRMFYSPFYLNWTSEEHSISVSEDSSLVIPLEDKCAQVLDGQHRLAGLKRAMIKDASVGDRLIIVIMTNHLETRDAAEVFININTEQRPVPRSLIYDLFGLINDNPADESILRAKDLADRLQNDEESPLRGYIKYPGQKRGVGRIELSTVVNALQPQLENNGAFIQKKLYSLETQAAVLLNFFNSIKDVYMQVDMWDLKTRNPFLTNAGFNGAIEALCSDLIGKCAERKNFKVATFREIMNLDDNVLTSEDLKGLEGKSQRKRVKEYILSHINDQLPAEDEYSF